MNSYLCKTEQHLRSIAKRNESVRYSLGLVILFLMLGEVHFQRRYRMEIG